MKTWAEQMEFERAMRRKWLMGLRHMTAREASELVGSTPSHLREMAKRFGIEFKSSGQPMKVTEIEMLYIKKALENGKTINQIARKLGRSYDTIKAKALTLTIDNPST